MGLKHSPKSNFTNPLANPSWSFSGELNGNWTTIGNTVGMPSGRYGVELSFVYGKDTAKWFNMDTGTATSGRIYMYAGQGTSKKGYNVYFEIEVDKGVNDALLMNGSSTQHYYTPSFKFTWLGPL